MYLLICTWFLKNQVWKIKLDELDFWSISNLIITSCVVCKIQVRERPKIKYRSLEGLIADFNYFSQNLKLSLVKNTPYCWLVSNERKWWWFVIENKSNQVNKMMSCNSSQVVNVADKCHTCYLICRRFKGFVHFKGFEKIDI